MASTVTKLTYATAEREAHGAMLYLASVDDPDRLGYEAERALIAQYMSGLESGLSFAIRYPELAQSLVDRLVGEAFDAARAEGVDPGPREARERQIVDEYRPIAVALREDQT